MIIRLRGSAFAHPAVGNSLTAPADAAMISGVEEDFQSIIAPASGSCD